VNKTSIIILVKNQLEYTKQCIESIRQYTRPGTYEIIVVDNGSDDGTPAWLAEQPDLVVIRNEQNVGFPAGCNQGIARSTGQYILLLNNDTIVTRNWLDNLLRCLESDEKIGAVGPVTNYCGYYQAIQVSYSSLEEMHAFAAEFNRSEPAKWEERLKLVGFCMLIKRSVIEKVGVLDERFTPGNYEDDDLSLRIQQAGYKLILCRDTFIHHYGSVSFNQDRVAFANTLRKNAQKFWEKWSLTPDHFRIDYELSNLMISRVSDRPRLLQINSGCGGTMLWLKNVIPGAILYGVEQNARAREIASRFMYMYDHWDRLLAEGVTFDAIIISHCLHELVNPVGLLSRIKALLKPGGSLFISVCNSLYYQNLIRVIQGLPSIPGYRYHAGEWNAMLREAGYIVVRTDPKFEVSEAHQHIVDLLCTLGRSGEPELYKTTIYFIHARPMDANELMMLLERLDDRSDLPEVLDALMSFDTNEIVNAILERFPNPIEKLNWLAVANFQSGKDDRVLPFLNRAYELDPRNRDTLYNLAYALYQWGHRELALQYLEMVTDRDEEMETLYREIVFGYNHSPDMAREITFLIRRMEYGIDSEAAAASLRQAILEGSAPLEMVIDLINLESSNPTKLLNMLQGSDLV